MKKASFTLISYSLQKIKAVPAFIINYLDFWLKPFASNISYLYPLKISENLNDFLMF